MASSLHRVQSPPSADSPFLFGEPVLPYSSPWDQVMLPPCTAREGALNPGPVNHQSMRSYSGIPTGTAEKKLFLWQLLKGTLLATVARLHLAISREILPLAVAII